jgi:pimeloyl-ACP methyl ester carboxylesterase
VIASTLRPDPVIALHCSGANAGQWRKLGELLGNDFTLSTPEHYGCEGAGSWSGEHAFTLADEAVRTLAFIDAGDRKAHLVGHSYGGGVALHIALARPERIASLTLYEPSAFSLLRQFEHTAAAFAEIRGVAYAVATGVVTGNYRRAATAFVDYWGGAGAWSALRPVLQEALIEWLPKAPLDFSALFNEPAHASDYAQLRCPTLILRGEHAPAPTRLIAEMLPSLMPNARVRTIAGAGHMGPLTHAAVVNAQIAAHLTAVRGQRRRDESAGQRGLEAAALRPARAIC